MDDLEVRMRAAASQIAPKWDDHRDGRVMNGLRHRQRQRVRTRRAITTAMATVVLVVGVLAGTGRLAEAAATMKRWLSNVFVASTPEAPLPSTAQPSANTSSRGGESTPRLPAENVSESDAIEPIAPAPTVSAEIAPPKAPSKPTVQVAPLAPDWRALAQQQDFSAAYDALRAGPTDVKDEPRDLLLASDVARLSRHPEEAVAPLRRVLRDHRGDARAPIAAFTLGRVLLQDLKRPGEAADAFAEARALDPNGSLAEDAHAREVEAAAAAGDTARARARAVEYVARYPNGVRVGSVKRLGGLE